MGDYPDQTRNLNPTPEARVAMIIWGQEYADQRGGSMDFWDRLSEGRKKTCRLIVRTVSADTMRARPMTKPWVEREIERLAHKTEHRRRLVRWSALLLLIAFPPFLPALALVGIGWCLEKFGRGVLRLGALVAFPLIKVPDYVETLAGFDATLDRFRRVMRRVLERRRNIALLRLATPTKEQDI